MPHFFSNMNQNRKTKYSSRINYQLKYLYLHNHLKNALWKFHWMVFYLILWENKQNGQIWYKYIGKTKKRYKKLILPNWKVHHAFLYSHKMSLQDKIIKHWCPLGVPISHPAHGLIILLQQPVLLSCLFSSELTLLLPILHVIWT